MRNAIYNTITLIFTGLSIVMIVFVGIQLASPPPSSGEVIALPTIAPDLPTATPTSTHTPTYPPTFTPTFTLTLTPSITPSPSLTITTTRTITPSPTITDTPQFTATASVTSTPAATEGPSPTSPSPFLFAQRGETRFVPNFANTLGCAWQGLGGQVFDIAGNEVTTPYRIHVYSNAYDNLATTGTNTIYGRSGWELQVGSTITMDTYFVELQSQFGTKLSDAIQVTFPQDCTRNAALIDFIQVQQLP